MHSLSRANDLLIRDHHDYISWKTEVKRIEKKKERKERKKEIEARTKLIP